MSDSLQELSNDIFNIKEKLTDNEFKKIMDLLGDVFEEMKNNVSNDNNSNMSTHTDLLYQNDLLSTRIYELKMELGDTEMMLNNISSDLDTHVKIVRAQDRTIKDDKLKIEIYEEILTKHNLLNTYDIHLKQHLDRKLHNSYKERELEYRRRLDEDLKEMKLDKDHPYRLKLNKVYNHIKNKKCRGYTNKGNLCSRNGKNTILEHFHFCNQHAKNAFYILATGQIRDIYHYKPHRW